MLQPSFRQNSRRGALFLLASLLIPGLAIAANGDCGQPSSNGAAPKASDAQFTLRAAVGSETCALCICDVNSDAKVSTTDALKTLKKAVGQDVELICPTCEPTLTGTVLVPGASQLKASRASSRSGLVGYAGLVPAAGATVDLIALNVEGAPLAGPPLATTVTGVDGSYDLTPLPSPSSQTIVRATLGDSSLRAFVDGEVVNVDPGSEFLVDSAIDAVQADGPAGLDSLSVAEIAAFRGLVHQADIDFAGAGSVDDAVALVEETTGGVYRDYIGDFATGSGPTPALAGSFHLVVAGSSFARSFTPASGVNPSINERRIKISRSADPLVIGGDGALAQTTATGFSSSLTESSGSLPQPLGPDLAFNASASLENTTVSEDFGDSSDVALASNHGAVVVHNGEIASAGALAAGSKLAIVSSVSTSADASEAESNLAFAIRSSVGLSLSSLSSTYSIVQLEMQLDQNTDLFNVHRATGASTTCSTLTFNGNGGADLGTASGTRIVLTKNGPPPEQPVADPTVTLTEEDANEPSDSGLTYTLSADGVLNLKSGNDVVATGAVTSDRNFLVLHFGEAAEDRGNSGVLIGVKRGSGMNNGSASGRYHQIEVATDLSHYTQPGQVDTFPSTNHRSVTVFAGLGFLNFNGSGTVAVDRSIQRSVTLSENSGVQTYSSSPDEVRDANVSIFSRTEGEGEGDGTETHSYSVASNGVVDIDGGGLEGYLSPDGNVFLLAIGESGEDDKETGILIGLRQP